MWKDIIKADMRKSPYIIEDDYWGQEKVRSQKTKVLFQGTQGEKLTEYWTPNLMEAVVYSIFGSDSDTLDWKKIGEPMIKQALPIKDIDHYLLPDEEYNSDEDETMRGRDIIELPAKIEYKYLPKSRIKELILEIRNNIKQYTRLINGAIGSFKGQYQSIEQHIDKLIERYF